jgi:DNA-directed RNA polymerase specialized sigma24 family protein
MAESVTRWIDLLKAGDAAAAQPLWQRYFERLVRLARQKLRTAPRRAADEEDVALSAFDSFFQGLKRGRFPQLQDREDLWRLLVVITARKAVNQIHHEARAKRGGGKVRGESALIRPGGDEGGLNEFLGREPTPETAALVTAEFQRLLGLLPDEELRSVALWKMEGYTGEEIAAKLGCARVTVQRMLTLIRQAWGEEGAE